MNIFDLFETPGMGHPRDTKGVQSAADQSAASVIGSGTTKREDKKKPVTMMGKSVKESVEEAAVKPNFKMPPESLQDKMYRQHQELRKQRGAPSPEEYKQRIAQKQKEIDDLKEGILDRAAPKLPKPRNPADQVLQSKVNAGGRHLDKKRRQELNPKHKNKDPMSESLRPGEGYNWTVHFADGTSQQVTVPSDEFDVHAYFAKRDKQVVKVDRNYAIQGQQQDQARPDNYDDRADRATKAHIQHDRGLTEQDIEEEFRLGKKLGTRRDRFKSLRKRKEGILGEFDSGEEGFGPFKVYLEGHLVDKFATFDEAKEEIEFLKDADPRTANGSWKIEDGTGETVWEHDPGEMYDQMRRDKKIQFVKGKTDDDSLDETIRKIDNQYRLLSKKGKNLGTFDTKAGAEKHEREVQYFKHMKEGTDNKFVVTCYNSATDDKETILVSADDEYDAKDKINYALGRGSQIVDVRPARGDEPTDREYKTYKHPTSGQSRTGIFDRDTGMSEATGDDKFDSMMGKIGSDPWTKIFSNPNFDENIEAFCERPLSKFEQKMSQMDIEVSEDGDTLNPLWLKYYIPFSTKMAQKFISQHKLNPNDPDLVMKVRHFIDWQANEGEPAGLLSGHKLPLDTVKVDDPRWDDAMDQMRPGMDKIFPDSNKREPDPRKLDPGMMEDMDEGWKGKLAGAALAGAAALGGGDVDAQNIDLPGPQVSYIAHVIADVNGREVNKTVNLGSQYQSKEQVEQDLEEYMQSKGITRYSIRVEQSYDQSGGYGQRRSGGSYATGGDYATAPIYAPGLGDMIAGRISREIRAGIPDRGGYATGGSTKGQRPRDGSQWWRDQLPPMMREEALEEDIERHLLQMRRAGYDIVQEEWSDKYKDSINCSNPKGFSQKAHCAGKKKNEDVSEEKVRLDPKCWKGKKIGNPKTKMKGGVRVNNCVPK